MKHKMARARLSKAITLMDAIGQLTAKKQALIDAGEPVVGIEGDIERFQKERAEIVREILTMKDSRAVEMLKQRYILGQSLKRQHGLAARSYSKLSHDVSRAVEAYALAYGYLDDVYETPVSA